MSTDQQWALAYARQAQADFWTWQELEKSNIAHICHRMLFLQMTCEKLCKARLILGRTHPSALQTSHKFIAKQLPAIIRYQLEHLNQYSKKQENLIRFTRRLANEIEVLNPAVDRNGQRADNCEYPWEDEGQNIHSPLDWSFSPDQLVVESMGRTFLKLLGLSIELTLEELSK